MGATLYYGAGAGAEATASSVVADIMDISRGAMLANGDHGQGVPSLAFSELRGDLPVLDIEDIETAFYLRISAMDKVGVMAKISSVLQAHDINIEAVIQKEPATHGTLDVPVVLLTDIVPERRVNAAVAAIEALEEVQGQVIKIRVEELDGEES